MPTKCEVRVTQTPLTEGMLSFEVVPASEAEESETYTFEVSALFFMNILSWAQQSVQQAQQQQNSGLVIASKNGVMDLNGGRG